MSEESQHLPPKKASQYYRKAVFLMVLLFVAFWLGLEKGKMLGATQPPVPIKDAIVENRTGNQQVDFSLFWDAWDTLKRKYVDTEKLDAQKLVYGAIDGMLAATGDPYTTFFDPKENKEFTQDISGTFEGIGAELGIKGGILTIVAPLENSPAQLAGLRAGDKIVKINGELTADMNIEGAVEKIRGQKGTEVTLTIFRNGEEESREVVVKRDTINVKSVTFEMKDSVAYIKLSQFGDDTTKEFSSAIQKAVTAKPKGLIIDMRNNPGGYLDSSIEIASKLLPPRTVVVIEEKSDKSQQKMYTRGGDVASALPTVVLVNEGSASASEILAGALKDNRENVTIVGKKSFGKGSVQEFIEMPYSTAVKITVARWLTPKGKQINEEGIHPDVEVNMTNDDFQNERDPQLDKALEILKK